MNKILFDSPNDLTSTYYASAETSETGGAARTYRLPDRDAAIFEIIYRYLNREQVIPLRKSACPTYLSYEQTLYKLAEEAKFYRFTKLQRALPPPQQVGVGGTPAISTPQTLAYANQNPMQPLPAYSSPQLAPQTLPPVAPSPALMPVQVTGTALPAPSPAQGHASGLTLQIPQAERQTSSSSRSRSGSMKSAAAPSFSASANPTPRSSSRSRTHSRRTSLAEPSGPSQNLFAYVYRPGQLGIRRGEAEFPIVDYPDDVPMPHLFIRVTNAEVK